MISDRLSSSQMRRSWRQKKWFYKRGAMNVSTQLPHLSRVARPPLACRCQNIWPIGLRSDPLRETWICHKLLRFDQCQPTKALFEVVGGILGEHVCGLSKVHRFKQIMIEIMLRSESGKNRANESGMIQSTGVAAHWPSTRRSGPRAWWLFWI